MCTQQHPHSSESWGMGPAAARMFQQAVENAQQQHALSKLFKPAAQGPRMQAARLLHPGARSSRHWAWVGPARGTHSMHRLQGRLRGYVALPIEGLPVPAWRGTARKNRVAGCAAHQRGALHDGLLPPIGGRHGQLREVHQHLRAHTAFRRRRAPTDCMCMPIMRI